MRKIIIKTTKKTQFDAMSDGSNAKSRIIGNRLP
jgi:hypothetical protein